MSEMMKVKIALMVGSNGKASTMACDPPDWGLLADDLMNWEKGKEPTDPDAVQKYWVEVEVPVPSVPVVREVEARAVEATP